MSKFFAKILNFLTKKMLLHNSVWGRHVIIRCAEAGISNLVCCAVLASLIDLVGLSWCVTFLFCSNCKCAFCVDGMFVCTLDILFCQITIFIKVPVSFVLRLRTLWLIDFSLIYQLKGLEHKILWKLWFDKKLHLLRSTYI